MTGALCRLGARTEYTEFQLDGNKSERRLHEPGWGGFRFACGNTVTPPQPEVAVEIPTLSTLGFDGISLSAALWGVYALRNRRREGTEITRNGKGDAA